MIRMQNLRRRALARRLTPFFFGFAIVLAATADSTTVTVGNAESAASNGNATTISFPLTRTGDLGYDTTFNYQTADGSAIAGRDYAATSGSITIPAGSTGGSISVPVLAQSGVSEDRQFSLHVKSNAGVEPQFRTGSLTRLSPDGIQNGVVTDINGDGRQDMAFIFRGGVQLLLNDGVRTSTTTSFVPAARIAYGGSAGSIVSVDLNRDGKPDLAIANPDLNEIAIALNQSTLGALDASGAAFAPVITLAGLSQARSINTSDFNGDGVADLAIALAGSNLVHVLLNATPAGAATPTFRPALDLPVGTNPREVASGDFNRDGLIDLVTVNLTARTLSVLLNTTPRGATTPVFSPAITVALPQSTSIPRTLAVGDFDSDGLPDIAVSRYDADSRGREYSANTVILRNATTVGAGTVTFVPVNNGVTYYYGSSEIRAADFNGDGRVDLVTSQFDSRLTFFRNTTPPGAASPTFAITQTSAFNTLSGPLALGDLNGDGRTDIAFGDNVGQDIRTYLDLGMDSGAPFGFAPPQAFGNVYPSTLSAPDVNGDGKPDLLSTLSGSTNVDIQLNNTLIGAAATTYGPVQSIGKTTGTGDQVVADIDGDGRDDILTANTGQVPGAPVSVLLNRTERNASQAAFVVQPIPEASRFALRIATADFNRDGRPDFVATNGGSDRSLTVDLNTTAPGAGSASFAAPLFIPVGNGNVTTISTVDMNLDGLPDILISIDSTASVFINQTPAGASTATFLPAQTVSASSALTYIAASDLNGDGMPDLMLEGSSSLSIARNTTPIGATTLSFAALQSISAVGNRILTADFDRDGRIDLFLPGSSDSSVLLNRTAALDTTFVFAPALHYPVYSSPGTVVDTNGDGFPDYLGRPLGAGFAVLQNQTRSVSISGSPATGTIHYTATQPVTLSPAALDFGRFKLGTGSLTRPVTLTNGSGNALTISSIAASGDFQASHDCPAVLAAGSSCTLNISFAPTARGARSGAVSILSNAASSPDRVSLSGFGTAPVLQVTPASLTFRGSSSPAQNVTLTNHGDAYLLIRSIDASADFTRASGCGGTLDPGASCTVSVSFRPAGTPADRSGTLTINSDAVTSPDTVALTGIITGVDTTPDDFTFDTFTNVRLSTYLRSSPRTITGINELTPISVGESGTSYSLNGGPLTSANGYVAPNDSIVIGANASHNFSTTTRATVNIGGVIAAMTITTADPDTTPNAFSFGSATVNPGVNSPSASVTISGIDSGTPISISGDASAVYSLNNGSFTRNAGTLFNGDRVVVRLRSSTTPGASVTATVNIGGVIGTYTVTTATPPDTTPDPVTFAAATNIKPGSGAVRSSVVTITGIDAPASVSITGDSTARFSIDGGSFVAGPATITAGQTLGLRLTAPATGSTTTSATVTIGTYSTTWSVTTRP